MFNKTGKLTLILHHSSKITSYFLAAITDLKKDALLVEEEGVIGHNWDKNLKTFASCYSQSPPPADFTPPPPPPGFLGFENATATAESRCGPENLKIKRKRTRIVQNPNPWAKSCKSLKSFPPCYPQSPQHLCVEISISSNSRNLLQFLQFSYCTL
jgi:hypothetical protein